DDDRAHGRITLHVGQRGVQLPHEVDADRVGGRPVERDDREALLAGQDERLVGHRKSPKKVGGGLRPPSEASPQDAARAAGRPWAGPRASEASNPAVRAAGRPWAGPRASEASNPKIAPAKPAARSHHGALLQPGLSCRSPAEGEGGFSLAPRTRPAGSPRRRGDAPPNYRRQAP